MKPADIEKKSFEIITEILGDKKIDERYDYIIKRCIHTSADFDYADNLVFSKDAEKIRESLKNGVTIVTDTNMAKAGINKKACEKFGIKVKCFIADTDVSEDSKKRGITRASVAVEKAFLTEENIIFAVGNAPTALFSICDYIENKNIYPTAVIGVPVGFVNVVESKERLMRLETIPWIVAKGRKGGSNIAACIINALLYSL